MVSMTLEDRELMIKMSMIISLKCRRKKRTVVKNRLDPFSFDLLQYKDQGLIALLLEIILTVKGSYHIDIHQ